MDKIVKVEKEAFERVPERAVEVLLSGGMVAYPTESFYGLAVDAMREDAIRRLFSVKKRRADQPVLILIPSKESAAQYAKRVSPVAQKLMDIFWPGGLTLVLEADPMLPSILTSGAEKIGIRLSSHPLATALARSIGGAVTGTSANLSGEPPCRTAEEVNRAMGGAVDLILNGGRTAGERPSTVLDVTVSPPKILREGLISRKMLQDKAILVA